MASAGKSVLLTLRNALLTLKICAPPAARVALGREVSRAEQNAIIAGWVEKLLANAKVTIDVVGRENIVPQTTACLIMSNHQSHYDIPVLFRVIGPHIRMVTKRELFDVPIFGAGLRLGGFVSIDRTDRASAIAALDLAKKMLEDGTHIWIAPEGTRSRTGELLPFKKGGFYLALDAEIPISPVTISGTREILPADGVRSRPGARVTVTIHPPIDPKPYKARGKEGRDLLMADVRSTLERGL